MIGATLTTRLAQYGIRKSTGDGVCAHVSRLQLQVAVGALRGHHPHSDPRPLRPAPIVAVVRRPAGDGGGHVPGRHRSGDGAAGGGGRSGAGGIRRRHLRHRHRRLSNRAARTTTAGRRVGHVAVRLADWRRVGRRAGAGDRRAIRVGHRVCGLCAVRAAGDARRPRHGRTGAPAATRSAREPHGSRGGLFQPARRVPAAQGRGGRADLRAGAQDRRHACQPDAAAAVRGPRIQQRRGRVLRRRRRFHRAAVGRVRRRRDVRQPWA